MNGRSAVCLVGILFYNLTCGIREGDDVANRILVIEITLPRLLDLDRFVDLIGVGIAGDKLIRTVPLFEEILTLIKISNRLARNRVGLLYATADRIVLKAGERRAVGLLLDQRNETSLVVLKQEIAPIRQIARLIVGKGGRVFLNVGVRGCAGEVGGRGVDRLRGPVVRTVQNPID